MITITALKRVPPSAQGLVRDLRVRWALEEAGLAYHVRLLELGDELATSSYRQQQPFGQVPVFEDNELTLFESSAIVLHLGLCHEVLLPTDERQRARAITWMFAAIDSIEVAFQPLIEVDFFYPDQEWAKQRRPEAEDRAKRRLEELASWLGDRDYLEHHFTAGDLMVTTVLRELRHTDLLAPHPNLQAFQARCQARPAFQRALRDHMAVYETHPWPTEQ